MLKTRPEEFIKFHKSLMSNSPEGYVPWYFPVVRENKAPDGIAIKKRGETGSWKADWAILTYEEALQRLKEGNNIGLSARKGDPLVIIDIDDYGYKRYLPDTLINTSRKRVGWHAFCWAKDKSVKINIPTDFGEVRSCDQYVVCAGSYCKTSKEDINSENIPKYKKEQLLRSNYLGNYTVDSDKSPISISFNDLPYFFREQKERIKIIEKPKIKNKSISSKGKRSALFDLHIRDIVTTVPGRREPHPLHSSDTGMNFSISDDLAHCWRHLVSLNPIQFLVVKSGYMGCLEAGTGHSESGAGCSQIVGDDGAIFHAWKEAKNCGLIPDDDPMPVAAMRFVAKERNLIPRFFDNVLPVKIYNQVIKIVEEEY